HLRVGAVLHDRVHGLCRGRLAQPRGGFRPGDHGSYREDDEPGSDNRSQESHAAHPSATRGARMGRMRFLRSIVTAGLVVLAIRTVVAGPEAPARLSKAAAAEAVNAIVKDRADTEM